MAMDEAAAAARREQHESSRAIKTADQQYAQIDFRLRILKG